MQLTDWSPDNGAASQTRRLLGQALRTALLRDDPAHALTLHRLFATGDPVRATDVRAALGDDALGLARTAGLLDSIDDYLRSVANLVSVQVEQERCFVASDFPWEDIRPDHVAGAGNAAFTLAAAVATTDQVDLAIDIGTGSGVLALYLSDLARRVIVTDVNPRALAYAELTAALSGREWQARLGSYLDPVRHERADLVLVNPPYVLGNPRNRLTFRDTDDERLSVDLAGQLTSVLRPEGVGQYLGNWLYRNENDDPTAPVRDAIDSTGYQGLVIERAVVDLPTYVDLWVEERDEDHSRWVQALSDRGAIAVGTGIVTVRRRRASARCEVARMHDRTDVPLGAAIAAYLDELRG